MEQMNFHKQKLYSLIAAGVALIALLLPWVSVSFFGASQSWNGLRSWGYLSLIGVVAVGVLSFTGNKAENYTAEYKRYVQIAFAAIAAGAVLFFIRKNSVVTGGPAGDILNDIVKTGLGLWICLVAGLAGLAVNFGFIPIENAANSNQNTGATSGTTTIKTPTTTDSTTQP
jgi:hypothetical protein